MKKETHILHAGRNASENFGIVNPPVYHASTVTFPSVDAMNKAGQNPTEGIYYGRMATPTSQAFEQSVAALEGSDKAIAVQSGLAAITGAILAFVKHGDHILVTDSAYFPTKKFCNTVLKNYGVETTYFDPSIGGNIEKLIKDNTKVIFTESPGSLTFEVQDIPAITKVAKDHGIITMIDNTWAAGYYFNAFEHGCDISIQAATKYIGGHSDVMLGTIALGQDLYKKVKTFVYGLGYCAAPDDCYLAQRGIRTLPARLNVHQENGLKLAGWLKEREEVTKVLHPAFEDCPGHEIWKRDFTGACGLFSVVLDRKFTPTAVAAMLDNLELFPMGYSWGGYESLVIPFDPTGARDASVWSEKGPCLRFHAGQENIDDLINDLEKGFERLNKA
ncbi:putative cystathionine beta-lyase [Candidatus Terasakiella magnetica]|uniref:Putative cystathionine beta-lyase n=1 Tax=Candidatus Terasakiella magnetica TaxID=1867952 RepID=A0A1C3RCL4_9PROT|nr:cystathionine beta-lyase [Candidatus Terasakiella magnetica]SCA54974.1 putative cystathionine beta-lyase [Candidatus Terasakiella magnetica]